MERDSWIRIKEFTYINLVVLVTQSCRTLSDPMDCSLPGSSIHGIFQVRVLDWGAIAFSENGLEWVNLTLMTIISTTVVKNPLEEME